MLPYPCVDLARRPAPVCRERTPRHATVLASRRASAPPHRPRQWYFLHTRRADSGCGSWVIARCLAWHRRPDGPRSVRSGPLFRWASQSRAVLLDWMWWQTGAGREGLGERETHKRRSSVAEPDGATGGRLVSKRRAAYIAPSICNTIETSHSPVSQRLPAISAGIPTGDCQGRTVHIRDSRTRPQIGARERLPVSANSNVSPNIQREKLAMSPVWDVCARSSDILPLWR